MLDGMAEPATPGAILARNIAAARVRLRLQQSDLADRMRDLGWKWVRQTVGEVENDRRRLTAEEVLGLAIALETTVARLMSPLWEDEWVLLPAGMSLRVGAVITLVTGELSAADSIPTSREFRWHGNALARSIVPPHELRGDREAKESQGDHGA